MALVCYDALVISYYRYSSAKYRTGDSGKLMRRLQQLYLYLNNEKSFKLFNKEKKIKLDNFYLLTDYFFDTPISSKISAHTHKKFWY